MYIVIVNLEIANNYVWWTIVYRDKPVSKPQPDPDRNMKLLLRAYFKYNAMGIIVNLKSCYM